MMTTTGTPSNHNPIPRMIDSSMKKNKSPDRPGLLLMSAGTDQEEGTGEISLPVQSDVRNPANGKWFRRPSKRAPAFNLNPTAYGTPRLPIATV
jgi:hypothetical protein